VIGFPERLAVPGGHARRPVEIREQSVADLTDADAFDLMSAEDGAARVSAAGFTAALPISTPRGDLVTAVRAGAA
jgi:hypothetical protein